MSTTNYTLLRNNNINTIIWICDFKLKNKYKKIKYYHFFTNDDMKQDLKQTFKDTKKIIDERKKYGNILIHCYAGIWRSAWIVLYYLMKTYDMNYKMAYDFLKKKRDIINPNQNFANQLKCVDEKKNNNLKKKNILIVVSIVILLLLIWKMK